MSQQGVVGDVDGAGLQAGFCGLKFMVMEQDCVGARVVLAVQVVELGEGVGAGDGDGVEDERRGAGAGYGDGFAGAGGADFL